MKKTKPKERGRQGGQPLRRNLILSFAFALMLATPAWSQSGAPLVGGWTLAESLAPALALAFICILFNGLFVASETAIELLRPMHLKSFEKDDPREAKLQDVLDNKSRYVSGAALGSQTMRAWMILLCFLPAPAIAGQFSDASWVHMLLAAVVLSIPLAAVNLLVGELIPKSYAATHPQTALLRLHRFIRAAATLFSLPGLIITRAARLFTTRFGGRASFAVVNQAEEEIKSIVETAQESGEIDEQEKELLHSVFEFTDTIAREVMTPRVDMDAAPIQTQPEDLIDLIQRTGRSRIPIYENTDDQIVGIVHAKDLLAAKQLGDYPLNIRTILRPALFVPENKNLYDLLRELRASRSQMAIVQDEFGGTAGVVTIEDIVEELVGDIVDEYDVESPRITRNGTGFVVDAKTNLYDLNQEIGSNFSSEEFDTIGGYVFGLFGRQPRIGEELESEGFRFKVEDTDGRRIIRLHVEPKEPAAEMEMSADAV